MPLTDGHNLDRLAPEATECHMYLRSRALRDDLFSMGAIQ
jgi:hypothetical protein